MYRNRKSQRQNINLMDGWLIVDKPQGMTSAQLVGKVKKHLNPAKIGHGGTLDPMATGILPLALGEATKAFHYVAMQEKSYRFTVRWGGATSTDDSEGDILQKSDLRPTAKAIAEILPQFTGLIQQSPPAVSAIKVQGKRAYQRSRDGEKVDLPPRPVNVYSLEILETPDPDHTCFEVHCGKGTYVRSLARDMGNALGCLGHISALRRHSVGKFDEKQAISLDALVKMNYEACLAAIKPIDTVLDDIPAISMDWQQAKRLTQGQPAFPLQAGATFRESPVIRCYREQDGVMFALGKPVGSQVKAIRVLNL